MQRLGRFIESVTSLALAIELYLKCLAIQTRSHVIKTHDFISLFDALPVALRSSLAGRYNLKIQDLPYGIAAFELAITPTPVCPTSNELEAGINKKSGKTDLRTLLSNEKDAFSTWRYLHEGGAKGKTMYYAVEFYYLGVFAVVLEEHIRAITKKAKS